MRHELGRDSKPVMTLMDMGTIGAKYAQERRASSPNLDESEEINACTVKVKVDVDGSERGLALPLQERDPQPPHRDRALRRRGHLHRRRHPRPALRPQPTSTRPCASPARPTPPSPSAETLEGKLPQRKLVTTAAAGYSSYGNQIGLATGQVSELYHPGYVAKRMEIGAVVGATPAAHVRRECPAPGDRDRPSGRPHRP